jgi:hypothetical protein
MSHRATIGNLGKDGIPQEVRDALTVILVGRIEKVLHGNFQPGQPHRLNGS